MILKYLAVFAASYVIGSLSLSIVVSGGLFGKDIRSFGSGNAGATNMARVFGWSAGLLTLAGDAAKAVLCMVLCNLWLGDMGLAIAAFGCILGHCYPVLHDFKGGLTENYVCSQLAASGLRLYYWTSGNQAEVDFVTRLGQDIIPIEVKSASHTQSRSLASYAASYRPAYCIRISAKNFGFENEIKSIPLYAAFCIKSV